MNAPALLSPENYLHSVCLQCNTGCGIRVKIENGIAVKIDGNPYSPWTMAPPLDSTTSLSSASAVEGCLCPKCLKAEITRRVGDCFGCAQAFHRWVQRVSACSDNAHSSCAVRPPRPTPPVACARSQKQRRLRRRSLRHG